MHFINSSIESQANFFVEDAQVKDLGKIMITNPNDPLKTLLQKMKACLFLEGNPSTNSGNIKRTSLHQRWFPGKLKEVQSKGEQVMLARNVLVLYEGNYFKVLSTFQKSYNKWRLCHEAPATKTTITYVSQVEYEQRYAMVKPLKKYFRMTGENLSIVGVISTSESNQNKFFFFILPTTFLLH